MSALAMTVQPVKPKLFTFRLSAAEASLLADFMVAATHGDEDACSDPVVVSLAEHFVPRVQRIRGYANSDRELERLADDLAVRLGVLS